MAQRGMKFGIFLAPFYRIGAQDVDPAAEG